MEGTFLSILILGFLLGLKHATEPDHVAAVATIVSGQRSVLRSSLVGALWGLGHTSALCLAGGVILVLRLTIPPAVAMVLEFLVGLMLVALGVQGFRRAAHSVQFHIHTHSHGDAVHTHLHIHAGAEEAHQHHHAAVPKQPFWIGVMHGLAGTGAVTVLVLAAVPSMTAGLGYLLIFGSGSILGMMAMSAVIGIPFVLTAGRYDTASLRIQQAAALASVVVGVMLMREMLAAVLA